MADFTGDDLTGSRFERVDLSASEFLAVNLSGSRFRGVALSGSVLRGVELGNVDISGEIENLTVNGVDIGPLIDAELNKRHPDRVKMRPADPAGFREAWDPLDLPWDEMRDTPGVPRDRAVRPPLETVLALRRDRMCTVRELVDGLTDASLNASTEPVEGPGWPPPRSFPVRECLLVVLNEEWEHRLYAERDLAALEARQREDADGRSLSA
jgi:hypothetical protein